MFAKVLVANTRSQVERPITESVFRIDPVDPRHRLVATKYNPARTWTPENAVGIGGAYICIDGMEGPGGYQLFGRTIQVWNTWQRTAVFPRNPWQLDCCDQIRFFPVTLAELTDARAAFPHGDGPLRIDETRFRWAGEQRAHRAAAGEIGAFKARQQAAFEAERVRWQVAGRTLRVGEILAVVETD